MTWFDDVVWRLFGGRSHAAYEAKLQGLVSGLRLLSLAEARSRVLSAIDSGRLAARHNEKAHVAGLPHSSAVRELFAEFAEIGDSSFRISLGDVAPCHEPQGYVQVGTETLEGVPILVAAVGDTVYVALPDCTLRPNDPYAHASVWHYILFQLACPSGP